MKKRRNVNLNILCSAVVSFSIAVSAFFYAPTLQVSADVGVAGGTSTTTVTYNKSEDNIFFGNTYLGEDLEYYDSGHYSDEYSSSDSFTNRFYYLGKRQQIFTSNANYYGYAITVTRSTKTTLTYTNADKQYWVIGTASDLYNGLSASGLIDASSFTAWVTTDNSVQAVHMAPFFHMTSSELMLNGSYHSSDPGSYNINCKYTVKYVGYKTKSDYESAMAEISTKLDNIDSSINDSAAEITDNMQAQTDTITNGYNSSSGDSMNNEFSSSVGSYSDASDNLFNTATSGLDSFGFANINAYSSVVTSLSFVQTVMASMFTAVGGESGPYGIVLSILFSVVLVSLLVGIYRYYNRH